MRAMERGEREKRNRDGDATPKGDKTHRTTWPSQQRQGGERWMDEHWMNTSGCGCIWRENVGVWMKLHVPNYWCLK